MGHITTTTLKNGSRSYTARYTDPTGKRHAKSFPRKRDAQTFLTQQTNAVQTLQWIPPNKTKHTLQHILQAQADTANRENTRKLKQAAIKQLGPLNHKPVNQLTGDDIQQWINECRTGRPWADNKPLSDTSIKMFYAQIKAALNDQYRKGVIGRPPHIGVKTPSGDQTIVTRQTLITPNQLEALIGNAASTTAEMMTIQASTGLRPSELCGLNWTNIDLNKRELHVTHQAGNNSRDALQPLKTRQSIRTIPLPQKAARILMRRQQQATQPVWTTRQGNRWTATTYCEAFHTARTRAGLPHYTPHALRHFYASLLIGAGLDVRTVQTRLGHAKPTETLNTYVHLWGDDPFATTSAVDQILGD